MVKAQKARRGRFDLRPPAGLFTIAAWFGCYWLALRRVLCVEQNHINTQKLEIGFWCFSGYW